MRTLCALLTLVAEAALLRSTKTAAPFDLNAATFLEQVQADPVDHLILLYSPTCPDCQWLLSRWAALAEDLRSTELSVWTVADPAFLAPEPFIHWHNPAIFVAPKGNPMVAKPFEFPEAELEKYLKGDARSQDDQDRAFRQTLLNYVADNAAMTLGFQQTNDTEGQVELNHLAESAWRLLQKRWGIGKDGQPAAAPAVAPVPAAVVLANTGAPAPVATVLATAGTSSAALVRKASSTEALVSEYTAEYVAEHGKLSPSGLDYIQSYYRKYFLAHPQPV